MPSPALDKFKTQIEVLRLTQEDKDNLKQLAEGFYISSVKEAVNHVERHLDAAVQDNPDDSDLKAKSELIRTWLEKVRLEDVSLPFAIHTGLET
jgi:hypothetical protein